MAFAPAHNPTDSPIVIDDEGRMLGGGEWGAVDADADQVAVHEAAGRLNVRRDGLGEGPVTAEAREAQKDADRRTKEAGKGIRASRGGAGQNADSSDAADKQE